MQFVITLVHVVRFASERHRRIGHRRVTFVAKNLGERGSSLDREARAFTLTRTKGR